MAVYNLCQSSAASTGLKGHVINVLGQNRGDGRLVCNRCAHFDHNPSFGHPKLVIFLVPESCTRAFVYQMGTWLGLEKVA